MQGPRFILKKDLRFRRYAVEIVRTLGRGPPIMSKRLVLAIRQRQLEPDALHVNAKLNRGAAGLVYRLP